jgi:histidine triad (HIT) family protein
MEVPVTVETCLFCKIIAREIPSDTVHEDELVLAFNDINPVAPVHQLIVPKRHVGSAAELTAADAELLGRLFEVAAELARTAGVTDGGYRLVSNVGPDAGQSVPHLHVHLIGGRRMAWPPG